MKSKDFLQRFSVEVRDRLGVDPMASLDIFQAVQSFGELTLVFYPFKDGMSGMCFREAGLIAINSHSTLGRQRFSLAHELYHYFDHDHEGTGISFLPDDKLRPSEIEREADLFASYLLMPTQSLHLHVKERQKLNGLLALEDIIYLEQTYKVSRKALLTRLVEDDYLSKSAMKKFEKDIQSGALHLGYDLSLYQQRSPETEQATFGQYLVLAQELKSKGKISQGKYESYLMDSFRIDMVYESFDLELYD